MRRFRRFAQPFRLEGNSLVFDNHYDFAIWGGDAQNAQRIEIGTLSEGVFTGCSDRIVPCESALNGKICFNAVDILDVLGEMAKQDIESDAVFLCLKIEDIFVLRRAADRYNLHKIVITQTRRGFDCDDSVLWLPYNDLVALRKAYLNHSERIRRQTIGALLENYLLNSSQSLPIAPASEQFQLINDELITKARLRNADFGRLINARRQEAEYQHFLQQTPFILNIYYVALDLSGLTLDDGAGNRRFVDLAAASDVYGVCDLWKLKKPSQDVFLKREYRPGVYALGREATGAVNQMIQYLERFRVQNTSIFRQPVGYILVGDLQKEEHRKALPDGTLQNNLRLINSTLHNITIIAYDELYRRNTMLGQRAPSE